MQNENVGSQPGAEALISTSQGPTTTNHNGVAIAKRLQLLCWAMLCTWISRGKRPPPSHPVKTLWHWQPRTEKPPLCPYPIPSCTYSQASDGSGGLKERQASTYPWNWATQPERGSGSRPGARAGTWNSTWGGEEEGGMKVVGVGWGRRKEQTLSQGFKTLIHVHCAIKLDWQNTNPKIKLLIMSRQWLKSIKPKPEALLRTGPCALAPEACPGS